jgi:hypothetical protein
VWPEAVAYRSYDDVPEAIARAASEAHQSLGAKAPRAIVAMARAVVDATATNKGITRGNLQAKIEQMRSRTCGRRRGTGSPAFWGVVTRVKRRLPTGGWCRPANSWRPWAGRRRGRRGRRLWSGGGSVRRPAG